jgi:hypothetical protein
MNKKILNEINRINSIMGGENILSEQAATATMLKKIFTSLDSKSLSKILKSANDDVIESINKLKKGESISDRSMSRLFKSVDFDLLSKKLMDNKDVFGYEFHNQIDYLIIRIKSGKSSYDDDMNKFLSFMDEAFANYPDEVLSALKKEVRQRVDNALKVKGGAEKVATGFKEGFKSPNVYRNMIKNVRKFRWPTKDFKPEEYQRLLMWLASGSSRLPMEMITLIRKHGLTSFASSLAGEAFKRYLYLTGMLTGLNFIRQLIIDNMSSEAERNPDEFLNNILKVAKESLIFPDLQWVIPALVTWEAVVTIMGPISAGTGLKGVLESITAKIDELENRKERLVQRTEEKFNNEAQTPNVDGAKRVADESIHQFIRNTNEGLRLTDGNVSYPITLENGVYFVQLPNGKIKLSDY